MNKAGQQPPPPYSAAPSQTYNPQPSTVIIQPTANIAVCGELNMVGPDPQTMTCPSCNATIRTTVKHEPTTKTHIIAILLCIFGCWLCCCIPYCMDSCQNGNHYCPNCGSFVGTYHS